MKNLILKYGLISGLISVALMGATTIWFKQSGTLEGGEIFGFSGMFLSMIVVFIGVRVFRDQHRGGTITFAEAFKVAALMALVSCVCYVIGWMFIHHFVMPDFMDHYADAMLTKMRADGMADAEIQKATDELNHYKELYKNPVYRAGITFMEPLPVALLVSLLSAAILRRK